MAHQPGEIYFVRERERSGSETRFIKIGLVRYKDNRDSFARLLEHQTGNPRELFLLPEEIVKTEAVDRVEAQLHRLFAPRRVSGEWFEFANNGEVAEAVARAQELAQSMSELSPYFVLAEELKIQESSAGSRAATDEDIAFSRELVIAKESLRRINELDEQIKTLIIRAFEEGDDITKVASPTVKSFKPVFLVDEFAQAHPDLFEQYKRPERKWQHSFLHKQKWSADFELSSELLNELTQYGAVVEEVGNERSKLPILNEAVLGLTRLNGEVSWNRDIAEARLKCVMKHHEEIAGVATWKRYFVETMKFSDELFAAENPDLAKQFISTPVKKTYLSAKKKKS